MSLSRLLKVFSGKIDAQIDNMTASIEADVPEIGIKIDRKELEENLASIWSELAVHQEKLKSEEADVVRVQGEIERGLAAAEILQTQGKVDKANLLLDNVEKLQKQLEKEIRERDAELEIVERFKQTKNQLEIDLANFEEVTDEVKQQLEGAKSDREAAAAIRRSEELTSKSAAASSSVQSSLGNMKKMAAELSAKAAVDRAAVERKKPLSEKDDDIAAALKQVDTASKPNENVADRIARMRAK